MQKKINCPVFVFFGPPGAGKGTQAKKLSMTLNLPHISTGDLLRRVSEENTEIALSIRELINAGKLVSNEMMLELLLMRIQSFDCREGFILDGFPRTLDQAKVLDQYVADPRTLYLLNICLDDSTIIQRLSGRRTCHSCAKIYHVDYAPSKKETHCEDCEHPLFTRSDDNPTVIRDRLDLFRNEFQNLEEHYKDHPVWFDLPAFGSVDNCFLNLMDNLSKKLPQLSLNAQLTSN
ncbi:MAG: adenylate kinase [Chlamydiae bacterium]|nr:adenylate kinase [Chlamydiota bacterium]